MSYFVSFLRQVHKGLKDVGLWWSVNYYYIILIFICINKNELLNKCIIIILINQYFVICKNPSSIISNLGLSSLQTLYYNIFYVKPLPLSLDYNP